MPSKKLTQKHSKNIFLSVIYFNRGIWVLFFIFGLKISDKKINFILFQFLIIFAKLLILLKYPLTLVF